MGMDLRILAVKGADEEIGIFQRSGSSEEMNDEVDDRLVAGEKGALEHLEIVEGIAALNGVGKVEVKVGSLNFNVENVN